MGKVVPKEGSPSEAVYLVRYDEDLFLHYSDEDKQFCYDYWLKRAKPLGCKFLSVMLEPDPLFPTGANEKPYLYHCVPVEQDNAPEWKALPSVTIVLEHDQTTGLNFSARYLDKILLGIRDKYPRGTYYSVILPNTRLGFEQYIALHVGVL